MKGFWEWLWDGTKAMIRNIPKGIKHPLAESLFGCFLIVTGFLGSLPSRVPLLLAPLTPIGTLVTLHAAYRSIYLEEHKQEPLGYIEEDSDLVEKLKITKKEMEK